MDNKFENLRSFWQKKQKQVIQPQIKLLGSSQQTCLSNNKFDLHEPCQVKITIQNNLTSKPINQIQPEILFQSQTTSLKQELNFNKLIVTKPQIILASQIQKILTLQQSRNNIEQLFQGRKTYKETALLEYFHKYSKQSEIGIKDNIDIKNEIDIKNNIDRNSSRDTEQQQILRKQNNVKERVQYLIQKLFKGQQNDRQEQKFKKKRLAKQQIQGIKLKQTESIQINEEKLDQNQLLKVRVKKNKPIIQEFDD